MKKINEFLKNHIFSVGVNLPFILGLGLVLRLISINQSLWLDEATTGIVARMSFANFFTNFLPGDFHPPLYYLIIKIWAMVFGTSEIALRLPSVIFGVATVYVVYKISKNYYAPLLVATSGLLIYYSQEARMYSLITLLVALAVYLFTTKKWVWFSIAILLLGMTDYVGLFVLPVIWILTERKDLKKLVLSHIPLLTFFVLWMPIFISQFWVGEMVTGSAWWKLLGVTSFKNVMLIPVKFVLGRISFENFYLYSIVASTVLSLFGYLIYRGIQNHDVLRPPLKGDSRKVIVGWLLLPIIIGILISFKIPTLTYFRYLFCLPALYILVAQGVLQLGKFKNVVFTVVLAINLFSSIYYLTNTSFQREDWRGLAKLIGNTTIILPANSQREALIYYNKGDQAVYYKYYEGTNKEIWLSRYVWQIFDSQDFARQKIENLGYNKEFEANFNGIEFWKYTK